VLVAGALAAGAGGRRSLGRGAVGAGDHHLGEGGGAGHGGAGDDGEEGGGLHFDDGKFEGRFGKRRMLDLLGIWFAGKGCGSIDAINLGGSKLRFCISPATKFRQTP